MQILNKMNNIKEYKVFLISAFLLLISTSLLLSNFYYDNLLKDEGYEKTVYLGDKAFIKSYAYLNDGVHKVSLSNIILPRHSYIQIPTIVLTHENNEEYFTYNIETIENLKCNDCGYTISKDMRERLLATEFEFSFLANSKISNLLYLSIVLSIVTFISRNKLRFIGLVLNATFLIYLLLTLL